MKSVLLCYFACDNNDNSAVVSDMLIKSLHINLSVQWNSLQLVNNNYYR